MFQLEQSVHLFYRIKKLEKDLTDKKYGNKVLKEHKVTTIIKLPENLFTGVTTSIFVFEAHKPQNGQNIIGYYIEEDGLETVKIRADKI